VTAAAYLNALLRLGLTAVNQQFIHILALRHAGDAARADRIYEVDRIDFPNVMRLIDHLVVTDGLLPLAAELPQPGRGWPGIRAAEAAIEQRLQVLLEEAEPLSGIPRRLHDTAAGPRAAYRTWLEDEQGVLPSVALEPPRSVAWQPAIDRLFAGLIATLEQTMVHAFVYRHRGHPSLADIAWAISGMAMVAAGDLITTLADPGALPRALATDLLQVSTDAAAAARSDRRLVTAYAAIASAAIEEALPSSLASLCRRIATDSRDIACWQAGDPHPALERCAPSFKSFDVTWRKFVG
jgi:hypothetical protein